MAVAGEAPPPDVLLDPEQALIPADQPAFWISSLANRHNDQLDTGYFLETAVIGGIKVAHRTKAKGSSPLARTIAISPSLPNPLRAAVPLSHRAMMELSGLLPANAIETFIGPMTQDQFATLTD